jgi:hypothetical protein
MRLIQKRFETDERDPGKDHSDRHHDHHFQQRETAHFVTQDLAFSGGAKLELQRSHRRPPPAFLCKSCEAKDYDSRPKIKAAPRLLCDWARQPDSS